MASGVETERGLAAALLEAPVHAVLVTRELKRAPGDLFLRTGSGRAKKRSLPHHVVYAAFAMVAGTPKDAVVNAKMFGALAAGKVETLVDNKALPSFDLVPVSHFLEGQSLLDATVDILSELANLSKVQDLKLGLYPHEPYKSDIQVCLTTRPTRRATIIRRISDKVAIERTFVSMEPEKIEPFGGFVEHGRCSIEVIGWSALVEMARLAYPEQDRKSPPYPGSNPPPAEGGKGDTETSAAAKTEAAEAPPSTASGILEPLADQPQAPQHFGHLAYTLSLSPREEAGTLGVNAGLWEGQPSNKQDHPSYEHAEPYPAPAPLA